MLPECGAQTKTPNKRCGRPAGWGTGHPGVGKCKLHGGASPQAEVSGALQLARHEAVVMGVPIDDRDPWTWLKRCIAIAGGELEYASAMVAQLTPDEVVGPVVTSHTRPAKRDRGADHQTKTVTEVRHGPPELHVWIKVRAGALDRCAQLSVMAIRAGLAEREVRLAEEAGQALADLLRGVLGDLGVPLNDPRTREVVTRRLALLPGGAA